VVVLGDEGFEARLFFFFGDGVTGTGASID
jgi:hypothetical protein